MNRIEFDSRIGKVKTLLAGGARDQAVAEFNAMPDPLPCADADNINSILAEVEIQKSKYIDRICPVLAQKYRAYCEKELAKLDRKHVSQCGLASLQDFVIQSYRQGSDEIADALRNSLFTKSDMTVHASKPIGLKDLLSWGSASDTYGLYGEVLGQLKKHRDILMAFHDFKDGERILRARPKKDRSSGIRDALK